MTNYTDNYLIPYPEPIDPVRPQTENFANLAIEVDKQLVVARDEAILAAKPKRGTIPLNVDVREFLYGAENHGDWECLSPTDCKTLSGLPDDLIVRPSAFAANVATIGNGVAITIKVYSVFAVAEYLCTSAPSTGSGWTRWYKTVYTEDLPEAGGGAGAVNAGFKGAVAPLGAPTGAYDTETVSAGRCRIPTLYTFSCLRIRIHGENRNWRSNELYPGAVNITGFWWGPGNAMTGTYSAAPTKIADAFTTPADGSAWSTPWVNITDLRGIENLLSFGWTNAAGQGNTQSRSGVYRDATPGSAASLTGGALSTTMPFHIWIEFEVTPETPVGAALGSSGEAGQGSTLPMFQTGMMHYCRMIGAVPTIYAQPGTGMAQWLDPDHAKYKQWAPYARPDFIVISLGQNTLTNPSTTLELAQEQMAQIVQNVREKITGNIFMTTVPPVNDPAVSEVVRRQYNALLLKKPWGVRDTFDVSAALSADDETIRPEFNADGVHANEAGGVAKAESFIRPMIPTPSMVVKIDTDGVPYF